MELRDQSLVQLRERLRACTGADPALLRALQRDPRTGAQALARSFERRWQRDAAERVRLWRMFRFERVLRARGHGLIAGVDEVGVGPLAGPVVAAAVILPEGVQLARLDDSKRLARAVRERLEGEIREVAVAVAAVGAEADVLQIRPTETAGSHADHHVAGSRLGLGNVVGSNVFNVLVAVGAAGIVRPFGETASEVALVDETLGFDLPLVLAFSLAAILIPRLGAGARWKGGALLLDAWKSVPEFPLTLVGDGPQAAALRERAKLLPNVRFTGALDREGVRAELARAAFLVAPSLCYETFGLAPAEALAAGRAIVVPRATALSERVDGGRGGLLFDAGDADSLARTCVALAADRGRCEALGAEAREVFEERFAAESRVERLLSVYREAASIR